MYKRNNKTRGTSPFTVVNFVIRHRVDMPHSLYWHCTCKYSPSPFLLSSLTLKMSTAQVLLWTSLAYEACSTTLTIQSPYGISSRHCLCFLCNR